MAAPYNTLLQKNDLAYAAYLLSVLPAGTNVYPFKQSVDKLAPCVIVHSHESAEEPIRTGNQKVKTSVYVKTPASTDTDDVDPKIASVNLVGLTFDALRAGNPYDSATLPGLINAAALASGLVDYTAHDIHITGEEQNFDEDEWVDTLNLETYCSPRAVV